MKVPQKIFTSTLFLSLFIILYLSSLGYKNNFNTLVHFISDNFLNEKIKGKDFVTIPLSETTANKFSEYLWGLHIDNIKVDREREMSNQIIEIDSLQMKFFYKIFGKKPPNGRSLYISLHGGGGTPAEVNERQWEKHQTLYRIKEGVYLVPRSPTNTWNMWHQAHIDTFFNRLIENMIVYLDVNPDRIYFMGYSAGGDGVYQLAPRMADRLAAAAMMAGHPNETSPLGLRNIGFTIHMGENDTPYNRNNVALEWKNKLALLHKNDSLGYIHHVEIYPDKGHWMEGKDSVAIPWISKFIRKPYPKRVVWKQDDVTREQFYWLGVRKGVSRALNSANIEDQIITIERSDVSRLFLRLNDKMLDMNRPVKVMYSEKELYNGIVRRDIQTIALTLKKYGDPNLIFLDK